jgi:hypothetical protein
VGFLSSFSFTIAMRNAARCCSAATHMAMRFSPRVKCYRIGIVTFFMILAHWSLREINVETAVTRLPRWVVTAAWALMACAIILTQGSSNAFIYFQF